MFDPRVLLIIMLLSSNVLPCYMLYRPIHRFGIMYCLQLIRKIMARFLFVKTIRWDDP